MATSVDFYRLACDKFKVSKLMDFQRDSIENLLSGRDVFLSTRTGGGKSLVYQAFQYMYSEQHGREEQCQVLVVSPLLSIMKEQSDCLNALGFRATYIGRDSAEDAEILEGKHDFLFSSPESILGVTKWRDMLRCSTSIRLIVVDEAHTIIHWGEADGENKPFREWFGKLGEMRSLVQCPLLLITATANKAARVKMQKIFCMKNSYQSIESPDRDNIKLFLQKYKGSQLLSSLFHFLISMLKDKKEKCERHIIFCTSIKSCSEIFTTFRLELGSDFNHVQMYHSQTIENVKDNIKKDMADPNGIIRVLVATSAAGMGVNFNNVNIVINFGVPKNMDSFVQQFGRAGRDGCQAKAVLLFCGRQCKGVDSDMKEYITNTSKCRRKVILDAYATACNSKVAHLCCDICDKSCICGSDNCDSFMNPCFEETNEDSSNDSTSCDSFFSDDELSEI